MNINPFGHLPDGREVQRIILSGHGLKVNILNYGAIVQDLRLEGHHPSLVLGYEKLNDYLKYSPYFGAIAGRCANRINKGKIELDGRSFQLDPNYLEKHCLHGGSISMGKSLWKIESTSNTAVTLSINVPDGHMGFPGNLKTKVTYSLMPVGTLDITMEAFTDKVTLCNLAHHSYFNLNGTGSILSHRLRVLAEHYNPVDKELIPTGLVKPVANTNFDFRSEKIIADTNHNKKDLETLMNLDHNFCLSQKIMQLRQIASLYSPESGVFMHINTTEPGLQIYTGAKINCPVPGLDKIKMSANCGIAMEPQGWPDSINHPLFPQSILRPEEQYNQHTQYVFTRYK